MYRVTVKLDGSGLRDPSSHTKAKISALYNLGCLLSSQDRHDEAIVAFEDAVKRLTPDFPPHSLYNMLGQSLHKVGKVSEAEIWFQSSLRSKPDHVPAHLTYALLLRERGNFEKAKHLYEDAIRWNPNDHASYNHFAKLFIEEENLEGAANMITEAYQTKSGKSDFETVMSAGNIFRLLKDYVEAERFYRIATVLKPQAETAHINLGAALHLQDKYLQAKRCYQSALILNPNSETAKINLRKVTNLMKKFR